MVMGPVGLGTKNHCPGESQQLFTELGRIVYPTIVARHRLGKHFLAATKNFWRRSFLCGPCHIKRK
jgi:hypothetical protein